MAKRSLKHRNDCFVGLAVLGSLLAAIGTARAQMGMASDSREQLAAVQGDRLKEIRFNAEHDNVCPQFTALLDSVAGKFRLLIPQHDIGRRMKLYLVKEELSNAMHFAFEKEQCRYILTVRRFSGSADAETEIPIVPRLIGPAWKATPDVPWLVEKTLDAFDGGFTRYSIPFDVKDDLVFSGAIYFARANFTIYLVNVPEELRLTSHDNSDFRAHEIYITNQGSRVSLALTREIINPDGTWRKVFGK